MTAKKQPKKQPGLSPTSKKLLIAFDEASQSHGWESDQGSRSTAHEARIAYYEAKSKLEKRILKLEAQLKRYRDQEAADHVNYTTLGPF